MYARNASGPSNATPREDATLATVPDIDTITALPNGNVQVKVEEYNNSDLTEYYIEKSTDPVFADSSPAGTTAGVNYWTNPGTDSQITVTGLEHGSNYYFRVKARNQKLVPTAFGSITGTVLTNPGQVAGQPGGTTIGTSQLDISWDSVPGATSYDVYRINPQGEEELVANVATTSFSDINLAPNTGYQYRVVAKSSTGASDLPSPYSEMKYTLAEFPEIGSILPSADGTGVVLNINEKNNTPGTEYFIEYATDEEQLISGSPLNNGWQSGAQQTIAGLTRHRPIISASRPETATASKPSGRKYRVLPPPWRG